MARIQEPPIIDTTTIPGRGPDIRSIVKTATVPTAADEAWADWASADALTRWWPAPQVTIDLAVGGPFEILFDLDQPEGTRGSEGCRYLSYVPGEMVSFTWNAPPHLPLRWSNTWVVITFGDDGEGGTDVRLVHTGFLAGDDWDDYMAYFDRAWDHVLGLQREHHATSGRDDR